MKTKKFVTFFALSLFLGVVTIFVLNTLTLQGANPVTDGIKSVTQNTRRPVPVSEDPATPFEVAGEPAINQELEPGDDDRPFLDKIKELNKKTKDF